MLVRKKLSSTPPSVTAVHDRYTLTSMQCATDLLPARALAVFPAGSNGEYGIPPELVPVIEKGEGSRVPTFSGRI